MKYYLRTPQYGWTEITYEEYNRWLDAFPDLITNPRNYFVVAAVQTGAFIGMICT